MSPTAKITTVFIIVLAVAAGVLYWYVVASPSSTTDMPTGTTPTEETRQASLLPSGTSTTDTALDQDLSAIDAQLSGLGTDTANVSSSLNDQPVTQSSL